MNNIKQILEWYKNFNKSDIVIKTLNNEFELEISNRRLPHLLGLHYCYNNIIRGQKLYNSIKNKSDDEIYKLIKENNPSKLEDVKNRVKSFKYFMENLDKATLVEQTHPQTKIKSTHLLIEKEDHTISQIGIATDREDSDYFETFMVRSDDSYFRDTSIRENVISIERYNENDELEAFSFRLEEVSVEKSVFSTMKENARILLTEEQEKTLKKIIDFNKLDSFKYENFTFYPVRPIREDDNILRNVSMDSMNFTLLANDENTINKEYFREKLKTEMIEEFYEYVPKKHKSDEIFYCEETKGMYIPAHNGLQLFDLYRGIDLISELETEFNNKIKEKEKSVETTAVDTDFSFAKENRVQEEKLAPFDNLPDELKEVERWVVMKIIPPSQEAIDKILNNKEITESEKKLRLSELKSGKRPYQITGEFASSTNENTWNSYEQIAEYIRQNPNDNIVPGFALGGGYIGIDIDQVEDEISIYKENKNTDNIVSDFLNNIDTYAEISPSGKGLHLIGKGQVPGEFKRNGKLEIYDNSRFFTMTGNIIDGRDNTIKNINESLEPLYRKYIITDRKVTTVRDFEKITNNYELKDILFRVYTDDKLNKFSGEDIMATLNGGGNLLGKFGDDNSRLDYYMANRILYFSGGDFDKTKEIMMNSGLYRPKYEEKHGSDTYLNNVIMSAFKKMKSFYIEPKELTQIEQQFVIKIKQEVEAGKNFNFISQNNYSYFAGSKQIGLNNQLLNIIKEEYNYTSDIWITKNQLDKYNTDISNRNNPLLLKTSEQQPYEIPTTIKNDKGEVKDVVLRFYNAEDFQNLPPREIIRTDKYTTTVEEIAKKTESMKEVEKLFTYKLLGQDYNIDRNLLRNLSDREIVRGFSNANYFVSRNFKTKELEHKTEIKQDVKLQKEKSKESNKEVVERKRNNDDLER